MVRADQRARRGIQFRLRIQHANSAAPARQLCSREKSSRRAANYKDFPLLSFQTRVFLAIAHAFRSFQVWLTAHPVAAALIRVQRSKNLPETHIDARVANRAAHK